MLNIRDFYQNILSATKDCNLAKIVTEEPSEYLMPRIRTIFNHLDRLIRFNGNDDQLNTEIKGLYRAILDYRMASTVGNSFLDRNFHTIIKSTDPDVDSQNISAFEDFDHTMTQLLGKGLQEGNEDIKYISNLTITLFSSLNPLTIEIEGNTDNDAALIIAEVLKDFDDELLRYDTGFEITFGKDGKDGVQILSHKAGPVMNKDNDNPESGMYIVPKEESDTYGADLQANLELDRQNAEIAAGIFFEKLQQAIASNGNIDPNDFENVTVRIIH